MKRVVQASIAAIALVVISTIVGYYITAAYRRNDWLILVVPVMIAVVLALSAWSACLEVGKSCEAKEQKSGEEK